MTLNNLGNLYADTQRHGEAEKAYGEALDLRRKLAAQNPAAWEPYVGTTLNNLGVLYLTMGHFKQAGRSASEAERILIPWWRPSPAVHGDLLVRILWVSAIVCQSTGDSPGAREHAQRALEAALSPALKAAIQRWMDSLPS
jgi:tetratricopeptide (TPR) repeat protein